MRVVTVYSFVSVIDCFLIVMDELEQMFNESGDSIHHQTSWHMFTSCIFLLLGRVNVSILSYSCGKEGAIYHLLFCFVITNYLPPCPHYRNTRACFVIWLYFIVGVICISFSTKMSHKPTFPLWRTGFYSYWVYITGTSVVPENMQT